MVNRKIKQRQIIRTVFVCVLVNTALFAIAPLFWGVCGVAVIALMRELLGWKVNLWAVFWWIGGIVSIPSFFLLLFLNLKRAFPERFLTEGGGP